MQVGAENKKKTWIAVGLFALAVLMVIRMFVLTGSSAPAEASSSASAAQPQTAAHPTTTARHGRSKNSSGTANINLDPRLNLDALKESENTEYTGRGRNIFLAQDTEPVDIPKPVTNGMKDKQANNTPPPPPVYTPPPPPPIELKFFGFASSQGRKRIFLSHGDDVFVASEGDIVNRRYKIVKVNSNNIEVLDVLNNNRQTIPLTAG